MDKLTGGFMMSLMQSGSADTWTAGAKKADKQHRDTAKMAEIEVFIVYSPRQDGRLLYPKGWHLRNPDGHSNLRQRNGMMALLP